jgi:hypothetical protein
MELRWLEGEFKHGKFKLQYRQRVAPNGPFSHWTDVPCEKEKVWWCEHWERYEDRHGKMRWRTTTSSPWEDYIPNHCPLCGAKRPNG